MGKIWALLVFLILVSAIHTSPLLDILSEKVNELPTTRYRQQHGIMKKNCNFVLMNIIVNKKNHEVEVTMFFNAIFGSERQPPRDLKGYSATIMLVWKLTTLFLHHYFNGIYIPNSIRPVKDYNW